MLTYRTDNTPPQTQISRFARPISGQRPRLPLMVAF